MAANAEDRQRYGPAPPEVQPLRGEVLTAILPVREVRHSASIRFESGLAAVSVRLHFASPSPRPAEVRYRLAVPQGAVLGSLTVCNSTGCRKGLADRSSGPWSAYDDAVQARGPQPALPVAHAATTSDDRGHAIVIRAAPVSKHAGLEVAASYLVQTRFHNGVLRLRLPARGMDPRVAPTELTATGEGLQWFGAGHPLVDVQPSLWDSWADIALSARLSADNGFYARAWRFDSGGQPWLRVHLAAPAASLHSGRQAARPLDLVLAVDASPSTEGPTRRRMASAIALLLANVPPGTQVRALVFAGRASSLVADPTDIADVPLAPLLDAATAPELGSATRFENAWQLARPWFQAGRRWSRRRVVVILGDGGLTRGEADPFSEAKRAGVEVSVLNVADHNTVGPLRDGVRLTGGIAVDAGAEAEQATRGLGTALLEERLAALFAPVAIRRIRLRLGRETVGLDALRAGEALTWEEPLTARRLVFAVGRRRIGISSPPEEMALPLEIRAALRQGTMRGSVALAAVDAADFAPRERGREGGRPPGPVTGHGCDPRGPAFRHSGISSDEAPVALAEPRSCAGPTRRPATLAATRERASQATAPGASVPAESLLSMLRKRIIPVARGCFRRDRAGRPDYQKRAVFRFRLAEREVVFSVVEGDISQALRRCLLAAVDMLDVPPFTGQVLVRYPLVTEAEPLPREIELRPEVARQVDALLTRENHH